MIRTTKKKDEATKDLCIRCGERPRANTIICVVCLENDAVGFAAAAQIHLATIASLRQQLATARRDELERCARVAEDEPEMPGDPPAELLDHVKRDPALVLRATASATKKSIASAIRALKEEDRG